MISFRFVSQFTYSISFRFSVYRFCFVSFLTLQGPEHLYPLLKGPLLPDLTLSCNFFWGNSKVNSWNQLNISIMENNHHCILIVNSNMTSFFRFVSKRAIYRLGIYIIISLAHAPVDVTDFPIVNVHGDELSSARMCATLSANVNINYRLTIKAYYHICTVRHIRIEIIHGS
jgi:hypothetical protein